MPPSVLPVSARPLKTPKASAAPPSADAVRSWLAVVRAYNLCSSLMGQRLAALGVRTPEHEILVNLLREPGITQQALAERCFSAKSHISALLVALEKRKWVRREADPADARVKRLFLAPAGERTAAKTGAVQAEVVACMAQVLSAQELLLVNDVMDRISQQLLALPAPAPAPLAARRK
jgi:DNA-binding MarR family transcriptional regulator